MRGGLSTRTPPGASVRQSNVGGRGDTSRDAPSADRSVCGGGVRLVLRGGGAVCEHGVGPRVAPRRRRGGRHVGSGVGGRGARGQMAERERAKKNTDDAKKRRRARTHISGS